MKISKNIMSEVVDQVYENLIIFFDENNIDIFYDVVLSEESEFVEKIKDLIKSGIEENL
jgi:broad-specificity NMP kinase